MGGLHLGNLFLATVDSAIGLKIAHFRFHWTRFFLGSNQFPVLIEFLFLNVFYFFRRDFYFECCFFISDRRFKTFWEHFIKIGLIFLFLE